MGLTLELRGIDKHYAGQPILRECSYTFAPGGFYILTGDNGSGKSTLFRLAALLETPDAGSVRYWSGEEALPPDIPLKRRITMVFPRVGVFSGTVLENAAYGLKIRGVPGEERQTRAAAILAKVGLSHKTRQAAATLSSGETMRLGLARALVIEPEVLFLDEPTTHLDRANTRIIEDFLGHIRGERSLTLMMITHDPAQGERLGGRRLLLEDGRLLEGC